MIPLRDNIPSKRFPFINLLLILLNSYFFYRELRIPPSELQIFIAQWGVIPKHLWADFPGEAIHLVTAAFLHGGWMHILSNMLFLFIFGDNVEDAMGHIRYLFFYFLVGIFANLGQALVSPLSTVPMIGASGAIAGVLGSYFFFYPHARVVTLIPIFIFFTIREVPAFLFLGIWFLLQAFNGVGMLSSHLVTKEAVAGVAWWAHGIGFISGILMSPLFGERKTKFR